MNIVILLGAPGSGKGTVAGKLAADNANLKHVSSGDLLRGAVAKGTEAGQQSILFWLTIEAAVYCGIINPEFRPGLATRNFGRPRTPAISW